MNKKIKTKFILKKTSRMLKNNIPDGIPPQKVYNWYANGEKLAK